MKKKLWKVWIVLILAVTMFMLYCFAGCGIYTKEEEWGNFTVAFYKGRTTAYITGLTAVGQQQRFIVIPKEIDGAKVVSLGKRTALWEPALREWCSDSVEKIYVVSMLKMISGTFDNCPNLLKALSIYGGAAINVPHYTEVYFSNYVYLTINPTQLDDWGRANVSYFYNYDIEENYGYYWIDDWDYGSKIEFIPPEPEREGYTFGGWYKEPECINKWDFETDVLPEERTEINEDGEEEVVYQETKLYAKWL